MKGVCRALAAVSLALLVGCAGTAHKPDCSAANAVPWQAVVPGMWVWKPYTVGDVSPSNTGHVVPTLVVVSGSEGLVIDPGPSHLHGLRIRDSLARRFGAQVPWVINTHAHAENVLSKWALADRLAARELETLASDGTQSAMQQRCPACLASLSERAGKGAMAGTLIVWHSRVLKSGEVLRIGTGYSGGQVRTHIRIHNTGTLTVQALLEGKAAAAYVTRAQAESVLSRAEAKPGHYRLTPMALSGLPDNGWPVGMAIKSENKELSQALEGALQSIRPSGELLAIFKQHGMTLTAP